MAAASSPSAAVRIAVHSGELYVDMMGAADFSPASPRTEASRRGKAATALAKKAAALAENAAVKKQVREAAFKARMEAANRESARRRAEKERRKEQDFAGRLEAVAREGETFVRDVGRGLKENEERSQRKKERLHIEWTERVFAPVQERLNDDVDAAPAHEIERRRRKQFEQFLEESNKKGGLFRDIIIEADYDPIASREANRRTVRAPGVALRDPTHLATNALRAKDALPRIGDGHDPQEVPPPPPDGRETMEITLWDKVESTPHGRYSDKPIKTVDPSKPHRGKTTLTLNHYVPPLVPAEHRQLLTHELGGKGKCIPKRPPVPDKKKHLKW